MNLSFVELEAERRYSFWLNTCLTWSLQSWVTYNEAVCSDVECLCVVAMCSAVELAQTVTSRTAY